MFKLETRAHVTGLSARAAYDFMIVPPAHDFQTWWPGTHLVSRVLRQGVASDGKPCDVGTRIYLEQMIGPFHVRETADIVAATPGRSFTRQVIVAGLRLPIFITFDLEDDRTGVTITHTIRAGFCGVGRLLDPLFRLYFTKRFAAELDEHLRIEYVLLREVVKPEPQPAAAVAQQATRQTVQMPALDLSALPLPTGFVQQ